MKRSDNWKLLLLIVGTIIAIYFSVAPDADKDSIPEYWKSAVSSVAANCASVGVLALLYWLGTKQSAESERRQQMDVLNEIKQKIEEFDQKISNLQFDLESAKSEREKQVGVLNRLEGQSAEIGQKIAQLQGGLDYVLDQQHASSWLIEQIERKRSRNIAYVGGTGLFMAREALPRARSINHPIGISLLLRPGNDPFEKLCASILCLLLHHASARGNSVDMLSIEPGIADFRVDLTEEGALVTPDGHAEETGLTAWLVTATSPLYQKLRGMIASRQDAVGLRKSLSATTLTEVIESKRAVSPIFDAAYKLDGFPSTISTFHIATSLGIVFDVMDRLGIQLPIKPASPSDAARLADKVVRYLCPRTTARQVSVVTSFGDFRIKNWVEAESILNYCSNNPKKALREIIGRIKEKSIPCQSHYNGFHKFYINGNGAADFCVRLHVWIYSDQQKKKAGGSLSGDIHTHSWSFGSCVLLGSMRNTIWRESSVKSGVAYRKLSRFWEEESGSYVHTLPFPKRSFYLARFGNPDDLLPGDVYWQREDELHSVEMKSGRIAATLVVHSPSHDKFAASTMYRHASIADKSELPNRPVHEQKSSADSNERDLILRLLEEELSAN